MTTYNKPERQNAISFILQHRGMIQTQLTSSKISTQTISKWINRQLPLPRKHIPYLEAQLDVPRELFVDNKRYCKKLTKQAKTDLENYFIESKGSNLEKSTFNSIEKEHISRKYSLKISIRKLQRKIEHNILSLTGNEKSISDVLDTQENNYIFYQQILELRHKNLLNNDEWTFLYRAIRSLNKDAIDTDNQLAIDIYQAIRNYRTQQEKKRQSDIDWYNEIWGDISQKNIDNEKY